MEAKDEIKQASSAFAKYIHENSKTEPSITSRDNIDPFPCSLDLNLLFIEKLNPRILITKNI